MDFDLGEPAIQLLQYLVEHNFLVNFRNRCYAYAFKTGESPSSMRYNAIVIISMSKMSFTIICTRNCNSIDS